MKKIYSYFLVFCVISIATILFIYVQSNNNETIENNNSPYTLHVIDNDSAWIYEIYNNDSLFIRQEYIPELKGKQSFKTKEDAEKIGNLMLKKLSKNAFPVISKKELIDNNINFEKI